MSLTHWKCPRCHGTGRTIVVGQARRCGACDGTGNAFVDGAARAHERRLREIDEAHLAALGVYAKATAGQP